LTRGPTDLAPPTEANVAAQLFFRSRGFTAVGVQRAFYEDAFLIRCRLADDTGQDLEEGVNRIAQYEES
jgi:hypothetical protein